MHFDIFRARLTRVALLALAALTTPFTLYTVAQRPPAQPNAAEILHQMQKLQVLGSVLYIVAHPDDENTKLIAWLANGKKVRAGNLSLTRGDGGQNLIGPELGDALGIIRTQELIEARRIDGGEQFFTRAVDFGYSKTAEESFEKWGKQEVLSDVVRVIRMFRPDVIITRFSTEPGGTHGHHTASAILAHEAFDLAVDPNAFPEQLKEGLEVWQPRRLFHNGSTWWRKDLADIVKTDPDWFSVDVGGYDPLLGLSYTEIAGRSRSMHKSQGFGAAETRGEQLEYLHFEKGDRPKGDDIFEGIDMTWGREKRGEEVRGEEVNRNGTISPVKTQEMIAALINEFNPNKPGESVDDLFYLYSMVKSDPVRNNYRYRMLEALEGLMHACSGVVVEANAPIRTLAPNDTMLLDITCMARNNIPLLKLRWFTGADDESDRFNQGFTLNTPLEPNKPINWKFNWIRQVDPEEPHWLREPHGALYAIEPSYRNYPTKRSKPQLHYWIKGADSLSFQGPVDVLYRWVDRVDGERIRPVYFTPVASIIPKTEIVIARGGTQTVEIEVEALTDSLIGQLNVTLPEGWGTTKDIKLVNIAKRNERQSFTFQLMPGEKAKAGAVKFDFSGPKEKADRTLHEIDYPHIMAQVYYTPAEVKLIPLDVKVNATHVGYIKGAGDDVPQAIERLGVTVDMIDPSTATLESISKYDAIVVGIRAYNTEKAMAQFNPTLMKFAENGGTVVVQYNTLSRDMMVPDSLIGPYPFKLSRDRVTVEEALPTFLDPKHPLLNTPNTITVADFDGWVQERGLYFVGERDPKYTALIRWNDPGEDPMDGALVTCDYGKGRYVYTGISFFRELPAGVAGAYRLWANLLSRRA